MKPPIGEFVILDEVDSTQKLAEQHLLEGRDTGVIFAHHQTQGVGRFSREWHSQRSDSATFTMIFRELHPEPWLYGMGVALSIASTLRLQLQWPNDLVAGGKKVGGILTELKQDKHGKQAILVGVGLNLNQTSFPESIAHRAISLRMIDQEVRDPLDIATKLMADLDLIPEPTTWSELRPVWMLYDDTPGKQYLLPDGRICIAEGIGQKGELNGTCDGEPCSVMAADAIFSVPQPSMG